MAPHPSANGTRNAMPSTTVRLSNETSCIGRSRVPVIHYGRGSSSLDLTRSGYGVARWRPTSPTTAQLVDALRARRRSRVRLAARPATTRRCTGPPGCTSPPTRTPTRWCRRPGWRCSEGIDRLRAALVAEDVALPDPHEHRPHARRARSRAPSRSRRRRARSTDGADPTFDADRFRPPDDPEWPGHWASFPLDWEHQPESRLLAGETLALVGAAIAAAPAGATRGARPCATSTAGRRSRSVTRSG